MRDATVTRWFERRRGIKPTTLDHFRIHTDERGFVRYPYPNGTKIRKRLDGPPEERGIVWAEKLGPEGVELFGPAQSGKRTYILTEGESDAMRLWQALSEAGRLDEVGVLGLSGANNWKARHAARLSGADTVYVVLDNEPPGRSYETGMSAAETVETAWKKISHDLGARAKRVRLPSEAKDVCEFFQRYDLAAFDVLLERASVDPPWPADRPRLIQTITTRELAELKPEPMDWIVQPLIAAGAITMLSGMMKAAGKSTFGKDLATAIAYGEDFVGWPTQQGSVVYVTEESTDVFKNSLEENHPRLLKTDQVVPIFQSQLFTLDWEQIVEEAVLEARAREAKLIVFDTLMDLAGVADENTSTDAARVMPLLKRAQSQGYGILLLVHSPKAQDLAIEQMFRGHGSWFGAVDQGLALRPDGSSNRRTLEMLGRLTRGRDKAELLWTPQEGWTREAARADAFRRQAAEAIYQTLANAPGGVMKRTDVARAPALQGTYPATFEAAVQAATRGGWLRERRASPGEKNPETGKGYRGRETRLLELTGTEPDFEGMDMPF